MGSEVRWLVSEDQGQYLGHVVAGVPGLQLTTEGEVPTLTLVLFEPQQDDALLLAQRLQLAGQII